MDLEKEAAIFLHKLTAEVVRANCAKEPMNTNGLIVALRDEFSMIAQRAHGDAFGALVVLAQGKSIGASTEFEKTFADRAAQSWTKIHAALNERNAKPADTEDDDG